MALGSFFEWEKSNGIAVRVSQSHTNDTDIAQTARISHF